MSELERAFNFTAEDLAANQAGHSSARQRKMLHRRYFGNVVGGLVVFSIFGAFIGSKLLAVLFVVAGGVISLIPIAYNLRHVARSKYKIREICGIAILQTEIIRSSYQHSLWMNSKLVCKISEAQYGALENGQYYCVYQLPYGQQILSINPVQMVPDNPFTDEIPVVAPTQSDHESRILQGVFGFSAKDLSENEAGFLTRRQKRRIAWQALGNPVQLGAVLFVSFIILMAGMAEMNATSEQPPKELLSWGIILAVMAFGLWWLFRRIWHSYQDIRHGRVRKLCGKLRTELLSESFFNIGFAITINDQKFQVSGAGINALKTREYYCIFFTPRTREIVSIKRMRDAEWAAGVGESDALV